MENGMACAWAITDKTVEEVCAGLRERLSLGEFAFDSENHWEWGMASMPGTELLIDVCRLHDGGGAPLFDRELIVTMTTKRCFESSPALIEKIAPAFAEVVRRPVQVGLIDFSPKEIEVEYRCHPRNTLTASN